MSETNLPTCLRCGARVTSVTAEPGVEMGTGSGYAVHEGPTTTNHPCGCTRYGGAETVTR